MTVLWRYWGLQAVKVSLAEEGFGARLEEKVRRPIRFSFRSRLTKSLSTKGRVCSTCSGEDLGPVAGREAAQFQQALLLEIRYVFASLYFALSWSTIPASSCFHLLFLVCYVLQNAPILINYLLCYS